MDTGIEVQVQIAGVCRGIDLQRFPYLKTQQPDLAITATVEILIRKPGQNHGVINQMATNAIAPLQSAPVVLHKFQFFNS